MYLIFIFNTVVQFFVIWSIISVINIKISRHLDLFW